MKTLSSTLLALIITAIISTGCAPMDESPMSETNMALTESETGIREINQIVDDHNIEAAKPTYSPGDIHIPVVGCDTMETPLVISYGTQSFITIGTVFLTMTNTDLYVTSKPYSGLRITQVAYYEDEFREGIPLDRNQTPEYGAFPNQEEWANGKPTHTFSIPLTQLNRCQAYSIYFQLATMNGPNGQPKYWDAWAWGHDQGDGYIMEVCIPECGSGQIFQS